MIQYCSSTSGLCAHYPYDLALWPFSCRPALKYQDVVELSGCPVYDSRITLTTVSGSDFKETRPGCVYWHSPFNLIFVCGDCHVFDVRTTFVKLYVFKWLRTLFLRSPYDFALRFGSCPIRGKLDVHGVLRHCVSRAHVLRRGRIWLN